MTSAYFAPLVTLPRVITEPGRYLTRAGEIVTITVTSSKHDLGNAGYYEKCGTPDHWHHSGRIFASRETPNDIVSKVEESK